MEKFLSTWKEEWVSINELYKKPFKLIKNYI